MKKRNQDGYVLVFVLVVVLVVLALCGAACTAALRNLKSQQASIEDLQSKLDAAGEVEEIYGALANVRVDPIELTGSSETTKWEAAARFASDICDKVGSLSKSTYELNGDTLVIWIPVSATGDDSDTHVDATLKLEATLSGTELPVTVTPEPTVSPAPGSVVETHTTWTLQEVKVSYGRYHVSTTESEGDSP